MYLLMYIVLSLATGKGQCMKDHMVEALCLGSQYIGKGQCMKDHMVEALCLGSQYIGNNFHNNTDGSVNLESLIVSSWSSPLYIGGHMYIRPPR